MMRGEAAPEATVRARHLRSGAERWLVLSSAPLPGTHGDLRAIVVIRDITAQRQAAEELRRSRDELDAILSGITDGILVQTLTGELLYVNAMAARIMGYASQEELRASSLETRLQRMRLFDENGAPFPPD